MNFMVVNFGALMLQVAGTSGMVVIDGGSDDEGASPEAHDRGIVNVIGAERRNAVLGAVHMVRSGVSLAVRQLAPIHVPKTLVANTPETLKEVMLASTGTSIDSLASASSERRQVAGRSLGELVQELGGRALPSMIPILAKGREAPISSTREYENGSSVSTHPCKSCADPSDTGLCDPWSVNEQASEVPSLLTCWARMRFPGKRWLHRAQRGGHDLILTHPYHDPFPRALSTFVTAEAEGASERPRDAGFVRAMESSRKTTPRTRGSPSIPSLALGWVASQAVPLEYHKDCHGRPRISTRVWQAWPILGWR